MAGQCPLLDLLPILEGTAVSSSSLREGATRSTFAPIEPQNVRSHQENMRRIAEWSRQMCSYINSRGVDGGSA